MADKPDKSGGGGDKEKKDGGDNKNEAESMAEKQRETLPIAERIEMFKAMLLEKEVENIYEKEIVFHSYFEILKYLGFSIFNMGKRIT